MRVLATSSLLALATGCFISTDAHDDKRTDLFDADGDGFTSDVDCQDDIFEINPDAEEVCDGEDNDCNGVTDEGMAADQWLDADGDGFGDSGAPFPDSCPDDDLVGNADDCDDADGSVNPDAAESCDGVDENCNGVVDEGFQVDLWPDADGDGFGDEGAASVRGCPGTAGMAENADDCDDGDAVTNPDTDEVCNGADENCNGVVDEGFQVDLWPDADGDGYGDEDVSAIRGCSGEPGFVENDDDCDDDDDALNPDVVEVCDGNDQNCNGALDEGLLVPLFFDADLDGHGDPSLPPQFACPGPGWASTGADCDDDEATAFPGNVEVCDLIDNDCNSLVDDGVGTVHYADVDADGFGDPNTASLDCSGAGLADNPDDCDDSAPTVNPAEPELCNDIDDNCDGNVDENAVDSITWYGDEDGDGFGDTTPSQPACEQPAGFSVTDDDCNDSDANTYPGAQEICDALDNDCDTVADNDTLEVNWYVDGDGDGFGDPGPAPLFQCPQPAGRVQDNTDCDDIEALVNPVAEEVCNSVDDDCDSLIDIGATDAATYFLDSDGDLFGDPLISQDACTPPFGHVLDNTDCDDAAIGTNPGATEVCDVLDTDEDCDTLADDLDSAATGKVDWYRDSDGDLYGDPLVISTDCDRPGGYVSDDNDCDDSDGAVNPDTEWFRDEDEDGFGDPGNSSAECEQPFQHVRDNTDCDDSDALINPSTVWYEDADTGGGDGYGDPASTLTQCLQPASYVSDDRDCAPTDPSQPELWYRDADGDTFGNLIDTTPDCSMPSGYVADTTDCDDSNILIFPDSDARETPGDGDDQDCDGNDFCTDLNCDGRPDLFVTSARDGDAGQGYLLTDADFVMSDPPGVLATSNIVHTSTTSGATGDFNGDGYVDVVYGKYTMAGGTGYAVDSTILWGSSLGYSASNNQSLDGGAVRDVCVGDVDNDGDLDIVLARERDVLANNDIDSYVHLNSGTGFDQTPDNLLPTSTAVSCAIADLDGDNYPEVIFANQQDDADDFETDSLIYWGSSTGYSSAIYTLLPTIGAREVQVADINNDTYPDIFFVNFIDDSGVLADSYIYWGNSSANYVQQPTKLAATGPVSGTLVDLDGDDKLDVILPSYDDKYLTCNNSTTIYYSSSNWSTGTTNVPSYCTHRAYIGDYDGDTHLDILQTYIWADPQIFYGASNGTFNPAVFTDLVVSTTQAQSIGGRGVVVGDIDEDGKTDIFLGGYYNGYSYWSTESYLYWGNGTRTYSTSDTFDHYGVRYAEMVGD